MVAAAPVAAAPQTPAAPPARKAYDGFPLTILTNAAEPLRKRMDGIVSELKIEGVPCTPIPDEDRFQGLYNGTCVFLVPSKLDTIRYTHEGQGWEEVLAQLLLKLLGTRARADEDGIYHLLLVELDPSGGGSPQYTGPESVVFLSVAAPSEDGEMKLSEHPLTRDLLPELARMHRFA